MIEIADYNEIGEGEAMHVEFDGEEIAVVKIDGEIYAVNDICSHEHYHLSEGEVDRDRMTIECPKHGSTFDLRTGQALSLPAVLAVKTYEVKVEGESVMLAAENV